MILTKNNDPFVNGVSAITLRDYFAAKAMEGFISTFGKTQTTSNVLELADEIAEMSYKIADAMIKEGKL